MWKAIVLLCLVFSGPANAEASAEGPHRPDTDRRNTSFLPLSLLVTPLQPVSDRGPEPEVKDEEEAELEKQLKELMEEIRELEKEVKKKVRKELLPLIRKEIERLRKWLKEFHPEDETPGPTKTRGREV